VATHFIEFEKRNDRRSIWMALLVAFEGDDMRNAAIALACDMIQTIT